MIIWRLCKARYAKDPLSGEGSRLYGGRWTYPGISVAYTASTLSLAALELLVHLDHDIAPIDFQSIEISAPPSISIEKIEIKTLPKNWREYPAPDSLRKIGSRWAKERRSLLLEVPSAVVPQEKNYLVNPIHHEFATLIIEHPQPFRFDSSLFAG